MKKANLLFMCSLISSTPGVVTAHGPGGGGQSYQADAPRIKLGSEDPFSSLPVSQPGSDIKMSV